MIQFSCATCNARYEVDEGLAGKVIRCRECNEQGRVLLPKAPRQLPAPAPSAPPVRMSSAETVLPGKDGSKLRPCPDCNREVSRRAAQCPHCGCPLADSKASKPSSFEEVFAAFVQAVRQSGYTIDALDKQNGRIAFRSGASLLSWGQSFSLVIIDNGDGTCSADVTNERKQLIDWGEGRKTVNKVTEAALKNLASRGMSGSFRG